MSFKILSLDGGGSWAMVQARVLADLYGDDQSGQEVLKDFNLVIATSGGSVFLGMLLTDMKLKDIVAFYEKQEEVEKLFPRFKWFEKIGQKIIRFLSGKKLGAQFDSNRKAKALKQLFENNNATIANAYLHEVTQKINQPDLRIVITGFDYFKERENFFRSHKNQPNQFGPYTEIKLVDAIHASCNAPINYYEAPAQIDLSFDGVRESRKGWFWDGAIGGFNNPVLAGLVEAVTSFPEKPINEMCILSIGTGWVQKAIIAGDDTSTNEADQRRYAANKHNPLVMVKEDFGFIAGMEKISKSIMSDPPDSASFIAACFMDSSLNNQKTRLIRINPCITPMLEGDLYKVPLAYATAPDDFEKLFEVDMSAYKKPDLDLLKGMCDKFVVSNSASPALENQLIRGHYKTGKYIGHPSYSAAKQAWLICK